MTALTHWDPFRALRRREETFEDFVREFFGRAEGEPAEPPVEVSESDTEVTVKMVVPGVDKDQLDISVTDNTLRVRGETRKESEEKKKNYYRQEIRYGAFERAVRLPSPCRLRDGLINEGENGRTTTNHVSGHAAVSGRGSARSQAGGRARAVLQSPH